MDDRLLDRATAAVDAGDLVVYPTETVYGLGADALSPAAVDRVFAAKRRDLSDPLSFGVATVRAAADYVRVDGRTRAFMEAFLPGPVTVVGPRREPIPDVLTAGHDRVGVRVPDHEVARSLLDRTGPLTATSANLSGQGSITDVDAMPAALRSAVAVVVDDGTTPGGVSTVVDPERGVIHRRGRSVEAVEAWLANR